MIKVKIGRRNTSAFIDLSSTPKKTGFGWREERMQGDKTGMVGGDSTKAIGPFYFKSLASYVNRGRFGVIKQLTNQPAWPRNK